MKRVCIDERRQVIVTKTEEEAYEYLVQSFIDESKKAVETRASFSVALSGGETPLPFYKRLTEPSSSLLVNWSLLDLFWSDERCVLPGDPKSNFGNASRFFSTAPLDQAKKHRLIGESTDLKKTTLEYEKEIKKNCHNNRLDLVLLGVGQDGHVASLFPRSKALQETSRLFVPNYVDSLKEWRLTITFPAIEQARTVWVLALGKTKSKILKQIFFGEPNFDEIPAQRLGSKETPATFVIDKKAAYGLGLR